MKSDKHKQRELRQRRVRAKIAGMADRPRLCLFRSNRHVSAQIIDDGRGVTLAAAWDGELTRGRSKKTLRPRERARAVGERIAAKAQAAGVKAVRFDRGGYAYHGIVAALAEGARQGGLKF